MIHLSIGRRVRGKTTLAMWCASRVSRRLVFDPRGMVRLGTTVRSYDGMLGAYADLEDGQRSEVVYTPDGPVQEGFELFAWHARNWVRRHPRRELAIVVDEAAFVRTGVESFMWVLRCSDPARVHVFLTAHRPADIATDVRAIADHWFLFAVRQEHDLDVVARRCGSDVAAMVAGLDARQFVHWDDALGVSTVNRNPQGWYFDLSPRRGPVGASPARALADIATPPASSDSTGASSGAA